MPLLLCFNTASGMRSIAMEKYYQFEKAELRFNTASGMRSIAMKLHLEDAGWIQ